MKLISLITVLIFSSCASMKGEVKGYSGGERDQILTSLKGKSAEEVKAALGEPVAEGICRKCGPNEVMQLVYLKETLPRYSFALTMANKSALNCFIIDLRKRNSSQFTYNGSYMEQVDCAADYGAIKRVRQYK